MLVMTKELSKGPGQIVLCSNDAKFFSFEQHFYSNANINFMNID